MGLRSKTVTIASALAGLAVFSQAPEFAQQYRQRIGGAVDELKTVVVDFDKDAANSQMSRDEALNKLTGSQVQFPQDRGKSMTKAIGRYEGLLQQQGWLENAHPLTRPLFVLKYPDQKLMNKAWNIFEPAVPLTAPGALYGGLGALFALVLARLGIGSARRIGKARDDKKLANKIEEPKLLENHDVEEFSAADEEPYNFDDKEAREVLAFRMENVTASARGVPEAMQMTPVKPGNIPYMKLKK